MNTTNTIRDFISQNVLWNQTSLVNELLEKELIAYEDIVNVYDEEDDAVQEVFSWYLVSDYLFDMLKDKGEPVIDALNCKWWGRTTFGQAIEMDSVIEDIFADLNK